MTEPLKERARGRWRGMLPSLGVSSGFLTGKHVACPICREGKDRFRFDDKSGEGTWICSHCGAGDGVKLAMLVNGWEFREAARQIEALVGSAPMQKAKQERSETDKRRDMNAVWRGAHPISASDAASRYLLTRNGLASFPACLRASDRLRYFDEKEGASFHPAMVAMVSDAEGKPVNIHRTYLTAAGAKAVVKEPRRAMPGDLPRGCAIRLVDHAGTLGIAEGIETAFSAAALFGIPCWSVINKSIMAKWIVPSEVRQLVIFGDNDANYSGQAAAYELGHRVMRADLSVKIEIPPLVGSDWNDVATKSAVAA